MSSCLSVLLSGVIKSTTCKQQQPNETETIRSGYLEILYPYYNIFVYWADDVKNCIIGLKLYIIKPLLQTEIL